MTTVIDAISSLSGYQTSIETKKNTAYGRVVKTKIADAGSNLLATQEQANNQNFFETAVAAGGAETQKPRDSTLQEIVLYYFFFSLLLFGAALTVSQYVMTGGNAGASFRTLLLYCVAVLVGLAMLLRYA